MAKAYLDKPGLTYFWGKIKGYIDEHTYGGSINERTVVAPLVSFDDGAEDIPIAKLEIAIEPVQDLHGYDNPWPAGGGVNKWDEEWEVGAIDDNGNPVTSSDTIRSKNYSPCSPNTGYYLHKPSRVDVAWYNASKTFISKTKNSSGSLTSPANAQFFKLTPISYGTTYNHDISINYPSTDTAYYPYSNICPITGHDSVTVCRTGVNVWDEETLVGYYNRSNGNYVSSAGQLCCKNLIPVLPNTVYYFAKTTGTGNSEILYYGSDKQYLNNSKYSNVVNNTFTTPANCHYISINLGNNYGATYNHDISINYPSTDHDYSPYQGHTYTIDLSGTRYGGSLDVGTGVLTVTHKYLDASSVDKTITTVHEHPVWLANYGASPTASGTIGDVKCSHFKTGTYNDIYGGETEVVCINSQGRVYIAVDGVTDTASLNTWLSAHVDFELVYELATPLTVQLDPEIVTTLQGHNNIWSNIGGDLTVKYCADGTFTSTLKKYVPTMDDIYPVGSIYISVNSTDPGTLFGGTWERLQDRFLLAAGSTYAAGSTGGKKTHTHTYGVKWASNWGLPAADTGMIEIRKSDGTYQAGTRGGTGTFTVNSGASATQSVSAGWFSNEASVSDTSSLPPYLAVYMWKRTA